MIDSQNKISRSKFFTTAICLYITAFIFICISLHKILVYVSEDDIYYGGQTKNFIVGGDAYNYIINGTHATVYMLLALIITIIATTLIVYMNQKHPYEKSLIN